MVVRNTCLDSRRIEKHCIFVSVKIINTWGVWAVETCWVFNEVIQLWYIYCGWLIHEKLSLLFLYHFLNIWFRFFQMSDIKGQVFSVVWILQIFAVWFFPGSDIRGPFFFWNPRRGPGQLHRGDPVSLTLLKWKIGICDRQRV